MKPSLLSDRRIASVLLLALLVNLGTGLVLPVLPLYAESYHVGYDQVGVFVSSFYLVRLIADLGSGAVVTGLGEARAINAGLAVLGLGALSTALAVSFPVAVVSWGVAGAGSAVVFTALYSSLLRAVDAQRMARAVGVFYTAFNGGAVIGGIVGGVLANRFGLAAPILLLCIVAWGIALLNWWLTSSGTQPVILNPGHGISTVASIVACLRVPGVPVALLAFLSACWVTGAVLSTLAPLFARDALGIPTLGIGVILSLSLTANTIALVPAGRWADSRGRRYVLIPSLAAVLITTATLGVASSSVLLAFFMCLFGLSLGVAGVPPTAMLADVIDNHETPTAVAILRFGGDVGYFLGPLVAGLISAHVNFEAAFALAVVPTCVALAAVIMSKETLKIGGVAGGADSQAAL